MRFTLSDEGPPTLPICVCACVCIYLCLHENVGIYIPLTNVYICADYSGVQKQERAFMSECAFTAIIVKIRARSTAASYLWVKRRRFEWTTE